MAAHPRAFLQCLAAALLFGLSTPASKLLLDSLPPVTLAGLLYLGAALFCGAPAWRDRALVRDADARNLALVGAAVLFGGALGPVLLLWGLALAPAASVSLWLNLETVATLVLAWAWFREHLETRVVAAAGMVIAASVLLGLPVDPRLGLAGLLVGLACVCWGLDNNVTALIDRFSPAQTTLAKGLIAGSVNLGLGLWLEPAAAPGALTVLAALMLGGLSYGVSVALYIGGAQQLGATRSQLLFATAPFWGVVLSWAVLREPVTAVQVGAAAIMIVAVWLLNRERHEHEHAHGRLTHTHLHRHDDQHHDHAHAHPPRFGWHAHPHTHEPRRHTHPHVPDLHHRHEH